MGWVRIDDGMVGHPKVLALRIDDRWRFLEVLSYCSRYRTDGRITLAEIRRACELERTRDARNLAARFVRAGLLDDHPTTIAGPSRDHDATTAGPSDDHDDPGRNGVTGDVTGVYYVHDYLDYQMSRDADDKRREALRERQARFRARRRGDETPRAGGNADVTASSRARKTRPDPPLKGGGEAGDSDEAGSAPPSRGRAAPRRSSDELQPASGYLEAVASSATVGHAARLARAKAIARGQA